MAFPLIKFASLIISQISQPLANKAKEAARTSPFFKKYICIPPARAYIYCENRLNMMTSKVTGKDYKIPPLLDEAKAVELGAGLVGDATVYLLASSIFLVEYFRRNHNKSIKHMEEGARQKLIISDLKELYIGKAKQEQEIKELLRIMKDYIPSVEFKPAPIGNDAIPEHHRDPEHVEEETTTYVIIEWFFKIIKYLAGHMS